MYSFREELRRSVNKTPMTGAAKSRRESQIKASSDIVLFFVEHVNHPVVNRENTDRTIEPIKSLS